MRTVTKSPKRIRWKARKCNSGNYSIETGNSGSLFILGPGDNVINDFAISHELAGRLVTLLNEYEWEAVNDHV